MGNGVGPCHCVEDCRLSDVDGGTDCDLFSENRPDEVVGDDPTVAENFSQKYKVGEVCYPSNIGGESVWGCWVTMAALVLVLVAELPRGLGTRLARSRLQLLMSGYWRGLCREDDEQYGCVARRFKGAGLHPSRPDRDSDRHRRRVSQRATG